MEKIIKQVQEWGFIAELSPEIAGFELKIELKEQGTQYCIFTYCNKKLHKSFSVLYDLATKEYFARVIIGLTEYFDANFIVNDINVLEKILKNRLEKTLINLAVFNQENLDSILVEKKILEWSYIEKLPNELSGFELFIKPCEPVKIINGSYIIIDYSDFHNESSFVIYYNIFRDEFFGEMRLRRTPQMSAVFDANALNELEENIKVYLDDTLQNARNKLNCG